MIVSTCHSWLNRIVLRYWKTLAFLSFVFPTSSPSDGMTKNHYGHAHDITSEILSMWAPRSTSTVAFLLRFVRRTDGLYPDRCNHAITIPAERNSPPLEGNLILQTNGKMILKRMGPCYYRPNAQCYLVAKAVSCEVLRLHHWLPTPSWKLRRFWTVP